MTSESIIHMDLYKPNNKLVNAQLEHFWCTNESWANMDSQDSPWPGLARSHHLPLYSILYAWPWGQHPNVIFVSGFPSWSPEILKIEIPTTLEVHNFVSIPSIEVKSKAKL